MALCIVGGEAGAGGCRGLRDSEDGAIITSYRQRTEDPKEYIRDEEGNVSGFYHGQDRNQTGTIAGEINGPVWDVFGANGKSFFGVPLDLNNPYDGYDFHAGSEPGRFYFDSIETTESRGEVCTFSAEITRYPGVGSEDETATGANGAGLSRCVTDGCTDCAATDGLDNVSWDNGGAVPEIDPPPPT